MNIKKLLALLLAGIMILTVTVGCGSSTAEKDAPESTESTESTESKDVPADAAKDDEEPVKLKFYYTSAPVNDSERIMEKANEIIREEINAELEFVTIDGSDYPQKMNMMINSAESWDLAFSANWGGMNYFENAASGAYYDLTDLIEDYAPESYSRIPESLWDGVKVNGKTYGVINYQVWGVAIAKGLKLRRDIAEEAGFDWIALEGMEAFEAMEAVEPYLDYIVENYPEMVPVEYGGGGSGSDIFIEAPLMFGMDPVGDSLAPGWVELKEGKPVVINQYESDAYAQYLSVMRSWYEKGYLRKDAATLQDFMPDRQSKRIGMHFGSNEYPFPADDEIRAIRRDMPHVEDGTAPVARITLTDPIIPASAPSTAVVTVGAFSNNPIKALELIELLNTNDELYTLIVYGEEGVDWEFLTEDDPETGKLAGDFNKIAGMYDFQWQEWQIGQSYSPDFTRHLEFGQNEQGDLERDIQRRHYAIDETAPASPVMGFAFDADPVKTELANCSAIIDELVLGLGSGSLDPEVELPIFIKRLEDAGSQEIIAEKQAQIDVWYEANH